MNKFALVVMNRTFVFIFVRERNEGQVSYYLTTERLKLTGIEKNIFSSFSPSDTFV